MCELAVVNSKPACDAPAENMEELREGGQEEWDDATEDLPCSIHGDLSVT